MVVVVVLSSDGGGFGGEANICAFTTKARDRPGMKPLRLDETTETLPVKATG